MNDSAPRPPSDRFIRRFSEITLADLPLVGGKNASLGELFGALMPRGVKVPDGFAITAEAYRHFLVQAGLNAQIRTLLPARF